MNEEELMLFSEIQKEFAYTGTRYDMTDQYKQMKDSDILAEKKKSNAGSYMKAAKSGAAGGFIGGVIGAGLGIKKGLRGAIKGAKTGAVMGGIAGGAAGLSSTHQEREDNRFANRRLSKMKYQAKRREAKDWKNNLVNREGYTY